MTVAATLEYLFQRPSSHPHEGAGHRRKADHADDAHHQTHRRDHDHDFDKNDKQHHDHDHEETSAQWLEDQGFDRKE